MSEKLLPSHKPAETPLYPEEWDRFEKEILALGFSETKPAGGGLRAWLGTISYEWNTDGAIQKETASVRVELRIGFPFEKPYVYPSDAIQITNALVGN